MRKINPWNWQAGFGFAHATEAASPSRIVTLSGQCATGPDGAPCHAGDMKAQLTLVMENLGRVLQDADMTFADVAGIRVYTTDMDATLANWDALIAPFRAAGHEPASTLVQVQRLFSPDLLVEIEATAIA